MRSRNMENNYDRIAKVIEYIGDNFKNQPELSEIADTMHLSPSHLHQLFTKWAGISPKRFLQFLTVEYAKSLLNASSTVLDTSYDSGLSGPGRLHDLFITIESVTPGEYKQKGFGLDIYYGIHDTPFGKALIAVTQKGICHLSFHDDDFRQELEKLRQSWNGSNLIEDQKYTLQYIRQIFRERSKQENLKINLLVKGTNFQIKVWQALLRIPEGTVASYASVADMIGQSGSDRAVGNAVSANQIAYLIPCHRVIKKMGVFGNYQWGETRKKAMIGWECSKYAV
jgi:AraC family transcriptional regulator of adaptative response/methylated-DNA-[protein]-cysteine methyltransferase